MTDTKATSVSSQKALKILYVSSHDPHEIKNWSGTPHFVFKGLKATGADLNILIPRTQSLFRAFSKISKRAASWFGVRSFDLTRTSYYSKQISQEVESALEVFKPDLIVGVAASIELAYVETCVPIVHISDATYAAMLGYYPEFSGIPSSLKKMGNYLESRIIHKASLIIYSSDWAKESAVNDYGASPNKIHVLPLGANVAGLPRKDEIYSEERFQGRCQLLFVGKEWERKGGQKTIEIYKNLEQSGIDVALTIVGCCPPVIETLSNVTIIESLDKSKAEDLATFNELFMSASFFVLPTVAEAYGLVFAEAAAFGVIAMGPKTGGVPTIIDDNETGLLMDVEASAEAYASRIKKVWDDKDHLMKMSVSAREKYERELNWDKWSSSFERIISVHLK